MCTFVTGIEKTLARCQIMGSTIKHAQIFNNKVFRHSDLTA